MTDLRNDACAAPAFAKFGGSAPPPSNLMLCLFTCLGPCNLCINIRKCEYKKEESTWTALSCDYMLVINILALFK